MKDRETEIKYVVPNEDILAKILSGARNRSIADLRIKQCLGPLSRTHVYYDTKTLDLFHAGRSFRVSAASEETTRLTFKEVTESALTRVEIQDDLSLLQFQRALNSEYPSRAIGALRKAIGDDPILPVLRVYKLLYKLICTDCEIVFGHNAYAGGRGAKERIDLEVEAKGKATAKTIVRIGKMLATQYGLRPDMRSKYEVGLEIVGPLFTPAKR